MVLTRKRLLLIGFILILLIGIPATLFVIQQQTDSRSRAEKATNLYYQPESTQAAPLEKELDETFTLDIFANPGTNLISAIRFEIDYDPEILEVDGDCSAAFVPDPQALPTVMFGPVCTPGKIAATVTVGGDPTKVVSTTTKIGTVTFTAIAETGDTPTKVSYGADTLVTSAGNQQQNSIDQYGENVLAAADPAFIQIGQGEGKTTPTPTKKLTATPTSTPNDGNDGNDGEDGEDGTDGVVEEELEPTATPSATPTPVVIAADPTATPTLAPTGPGETVLGFGFVVTALTIIGGILFFAL